MEPTPKTVSSTGLSDEAVSAIRQFYQRDDISRQAPGRKDAVTMRDKHETDGSITKIQLWHLTSSVAENYALFCSEYPDLKVGRTKFYELRPSHLLLSSKLPHNVCLCREHKHFIAQQ